VTQVTVKLIPKSGRSELKYEGALLKIWVKSAPEDGKANAELIRTLADILKIPRKEIQILRGSSSRIKVVDIRGITVEDLKKAAQ
jgi:uncharacterized protein (TIGR00251 family)